MKICFICFGFMEKNIRLQPWKYIYELAINLNSDSNSINVITDIQPFFRGGNNYQGIQISCLPLRPKFSFKNKELINLINKINPDVILWLLGPTSIYLIPTIKKLDVSIIALWIGTSYNLNQIITLGLHELIRNFSSIYLHIINGLIPKFFISYLINLNNIHKVVVLNETNRKLLLDYGVIPRKIEVIPPGIAAHDLIHPNDQEIMDYKTRHGFRKDDFLILYIGSPLTLRGVDTLIKGFNLANEMDSSLKLLILSRHWLNELNKESKYIKKLSTNNNNIFILSGFLDIGDVKIYIALSDLVVLPFKLVQSDTPIAILEAMALGKTVISTNVGCISEILEKRGIVLNTNNPKELADSILKVCNDREILLKYDMDSRKYMETYPKWEDISDKFAKMFHLIND